MWWAETEPCSATWHMHSRDVPSPACSTLTCPPSWWSAVHCACCFRSNELLLGRAWPAAISALAPLFAFALPSTLSFGFALGRAPDFAAMDVLLWPRFCRHFCWLPSCGGSFWRLEARRRPLGLGRWSWWATWNQIPHLGAVHADIVCSRHGDERLWSERSRSSDHALLQPSQSDWGNELHLGRLLMDFSTPLLRKQFAKGEKYVGCYFTRKNLKYRP